MLKACKELLMLINRKQMSDIYLYCWTLIEPPFNQYY